MDESEVSQHQANVDKLVTQTSRINADNGDEFTFAWQAGSDSLLFSVNGTGVAVVNDAFVCWAMFDYYFGDQPIAPSLKSSVESQWYERTRTSPQAHELLSKGRLTVRE